VATFDGVLIWGVDYKVWLVTFQVAGYACSKFIGIKVISELKSSGRKRGIMIVSCIATLSWLGFALIAPPFNFIFLFINGLVLGLAWGMVFSYLEGRRVTEVLGAALSTSFIFSSGLCRSVGSYVMLHWHVSEKWMPFVVAVLSFVPLLFFLWLLDKVPPPSIEDERLRSKRIPMNGNERIKFVRTFLPGIVLFVFAYMLLTTFRDFRDNFSAEVWKELGYATSSSIYTLTEVPVSIAVLIVIGLTMLIKNNKAAFMANHLIILFGLMLLLFTNWLFQYHSLNPVVWMQLMGLGLYLGYVPFNSIFFDRMLSTYRVTGTVGFIMYVADAFGYLGSIGVLFVKQFLSVNTGWLSFMTDAGNILGWLGSGLILCSMIYFYKKKVSPNGWPS
jgi:MFS family permease